MAGHHTLHWLTAGWTTRPTSDHSLSEQPPSRHHSISTCQQWLGLDNRHNCRTSRPAHLQDG